MKRLINKATKFVRETVRESLSRRFVISLTLEGFFLAGAMLLIGLAALRTGVPLLYMMLSMMGAFFILSAFLATNTMRRLAVSRRLPKVWRAGQPVPVTITVSNNKGRTASYSLRVMDHSEKEDSPVGGVFIEKLEPNGVAVEAAYECLFLRRGRYRFKEVEIATRFPFGLIERRLLISLPSEILILPQVVDLGPTALPGYTERGEVETNIKGNGTSLHGLRDYTHEMPARDIHWKVSARRGHLVAREFEVEEKRRASVIIDNTVGGSGRLADTLEFELQIILANSILHRLDRLGFDVELRTASGVIAHGSGREHLLRCSRALASLEQEPATNDNRRIIQQIPMNSRRITITRQLSDEAGEGAISINQFRPILINAFEAPKAQQQRPTRVDERVDDLVEASA